MWIEFKIRHGGTVEVPQGLDCMAEGRCYKCVHTPAVRTAVNAPWLKKANLGSAIGPGSSPGSKFSIAKRDLNALSVRTP